MKTVNWLKCLFGYHEWYCIEEITGQRGSWLIFECKECHKIEFQ